MADNVAITAGSGTTVAADEVIDGTLGTVKVQFVKIMDGTLDGTSKAAVGANGLESHDALANTAIGATGDAAVTAGASGSISAKLRSISRDLVANIVLAAGSAIIGKVGIDQTTPGTTDSVTLKATEAHLGEVGGNLTMISTELTRPADTNAYAANDVVSDSTSATTMQALANAARVSGGSGYITGIRVNTDKKSITPRIRVHLFNTNGATVAADNVAMKTIYADNSKYVGWWDMPAMITGGDTTNSTNSYAEDLTVRIPYTCAATTLYYVLETLDAFTPASGEKVTVTVFVDRN